MQYDLAAKKGCRKEVRSIFVIRPSDECQLDLYQIQRAELYVLTSDNININP